MTVGGRIGTVLLVRARQDGARRRQREHNGDKSDGFLHNLLLCGSVIWLVELTAFTIKYKKLSTKIGSILR
jgi:hypothetical protein